MAKPPKGYKDRAIALRRLGILPKGYNTSRLNESQKRHIRRTEAKLRSNYGEISAHPDAWISGEIPAGDAGKLRGKGYRTIRTREGTRFFVSRQHSDRVRWNDESESLTRFYPNRRVRAYPMDDTAATRRRLTRFFATRKRGEYITLQIGDHNPFRVAIYSLADFDRYLGRFEEMLDEREDGDEKFRRDNPRELLQIVEVRRGK